MTKRFRNRLRKVYFPFDDSRWTPVAEAYYRNTKKEVMVLSVLMPCALAIALILFIVFPSNLFFKIYGSILVSLLFGVPWLMMNFRFWFCDIEFID